MSPHALKVAALLCGSGACALVYQIAWQRELRLVFGASTAASAAVVAIFAFGLGLGGLLFGPRAERHPRPLLLYAWLEGLVAVTAGLSPLLLWLVRVAYVGIGGTTVLGPAVGTVARLLLAALVFSVPTVLMGGTLPAAARAIARESDDSRRGVGLLYGLNTLGAVAGSLAVTFAFLEVLGTRRTLLCASLANLLVAVVARGIARRLPAPEPPPAAAPTLASAAPAWAVLGAAALVGFAFFLMELVWYRLLGPLLGGTVFTFGLVLAVALLGIGLGGALYPLLFARRPATAHAFAWICLLEALGLAVPYALGDRLAVLALLLRPLGNASFGGLIAGWLCVAGIVVLPAALAAGVQFPLLIALLGRGGRQVGRQVGLAYAWNTAGAVLGALSGGFGLLAWLSAPGCWRLCGGLLGALGVAAAALAVHRDHRATHAVGPLLLAAGVAASLAAPGPTAAWRHSGIGAGRKSVAVTRSRTTTRDFLHAQRRKVLWQAEGRESSVALSRETGLAFFINGKSDGHALHDAATQVMGGLLGALLHPAPRRALVIGLGTGSSAGWLGAVPEMERVDVVELEPTVVTVARECRPVNHDALTNPKVRVVLGDAREVLLTTRQRYDVVFSEPSNPYRAGIASLFTREYYRAVAERLAPGGLFLQWVQAYEIDAQTLRTVYATLAAVFPSVETWELKSNDLLLVASRAPRTYDAGWLRARMGQEPFRSALEAAWWVDDLEGLVAHHVARPSLAQAIARLEGDDVNTDDQTLVEFGFAREVGRQTDFGAMTVRRTARARGEDRAEINGPLDWERVEDGHAVIRAVAQQPPDLSGDLTPAQRRRQRAYGFWVQGRLDAVRAEWRAQSRAPAGSFEVAVVAEALADAGDEHASPLIARLRDRRPVDADMILGRLRFRQGRLDDALAIYEAAFERYRHDPWPAELVAGRALEVVEALAQDRGRAPRLLRLLERPFVLYALDAERLRAALVIGGSDPATCVPIISAFEPYIPWTEEFLTVRRDCYAGARTADLARAEADLRAFLRDTPARFDRGLVETNDRPGPGAPPP